MKIDEIRNKIQAAKIAAENECFSLNLAERMTEEEAKRYTAASETVKHANRAAKALDNLEEREIQPNAQRLDYEINAAAKQYHDAKKVVEMLQKQMRHGLAEGEFSAACAAKHAAEEIVMGYLDKQHNFIALTAFVTE